MISVVLLEPEKPGNIGAVARVMKNFDFADLVLINPKCDHLSIESEQRAKHAVDIVRSAKIRSFDYLDQFDYLVGTTSKLGTDYNIPRSPLTPDKLAEVIKDNDAKIGIVFGRESSGLTNEEVQKCDYIVSVPSSEEYPALNLSHSVAIILYELYRVIGKNKITEHFISATKTEKDQIFKILDEVMSDLEFATDEKRETQRVVWKRLIGKSMMTKREAFALIGFLKKLL